MCSKKLRISYTVRLLVFEFVTLFFYNALHETLGSIFICLWTEYFVLLINYNYTLLINANLIYNILIDVLRYLWILFFSIIFSFLLRASWFSFYRRGLNRNRKKSITISLLYYSFWLIKTQLLFNYGILRSIILYY